MAKSIKPSRIISDEDRTVFLREEFEGERLVNVIRFVFMFILEFLALAKNGLFTGLDIDISLKLTTLLISIATVYCLILFLIFRKDIYHPSIKYISIFVNITVVVLSVALYRLEDMDEYAQIYTMARPAVLYILLILSTLNYSFFVSLYAGLLAGLEFAVLVVLGNPFNSLPFWFELGDGVRLESAFESTEAILRVVYMVLGGATAGLVANRLRALVRRIIAEGKEKSRLESEKALIDVVNSENKKYLDTISDGLVLIDSGYIMSSQFSSSFVDIFGRDDLAGKSFVDLVYPDAAAKAAERKELEGFLKILFTNTLADLDMILDINPLHSFTLVSASGGKDKILQFDFKLVAGIRGELDTVMVIVRDKTKEVLAEMELNEEKERHGEEVETISAILKTPLSTLRSFFEEANDQIDTIELLIGDMGDAAGMEKAFREMHSLKGSARTLGFKSISDTAHKVEDSLTSLRNSKRAPSDRLRETIKTGVADLYNQLNRIKSLYDLFRKAVQETQALPEISEESQLVDFLLLVKKMAGDVGKELDKDILFTTAMQVDKLNCLKEIKNSLIHLVRNSVDHGIEDRYQRLSVGKTAEGHIKLQLAEADGTYVLVLSDDGRGIDYEDVRKKAIERKLLSADKKATQSELLRFLFMPNFSLKRELTDISGRGVGLDIVKNAVDKLGGKISVSTSLGVGTSFRLTIPKVRPRAQA